MKKILIAALMCAAALNVNAQNIQLHYDFGRHIYSDEEGSRQNVTLTYEAFKADGLGSWYYFIDADLDRDGVMGAYTEISREFTFSKPTESSSLAAHLEFDGGMNRGGSFQSAALVGPAWNWHNGDFSKTLSVQAMYKQFFSQKYGPKGYASFQLTGVWGVNFAGSKCTFSGFIDFWRGEKYNHHGQLVILTEPQLWYNISPKVSFGTEIEISNNFIYNTYNDKSFFINPTLAFKFNL